MARLIDADALNTDYIQSLTSNADVYLTARKLIDDAPTVDAAMVVHGTWIREFDNLGIDRGYKCSVCRGSVYHMTYEPYIFCPHCGAKMHGEEREGKNGNTK